jgi:hypothetical protein
LPARRFPPTWSIDELEACFVVKEANGAEARLFLLRGGARPAAAKMLTKDEPRRIAANIAKLPDLLRKD